MKKFRFQFETVLRLRKNRENDALRALAVAQRAYQADLERKAALVSELKAALLRRENLGTEAIGIDAFQIEENFIVGTKQRIIRQDQALVRASRAVEKNLRAYLHARRQTHTIELLREKQYLAFKKAVAKKEQKDLDELTVMRARLVALAGIDEEADDVSEKETA